MEDETTIGDDTDDTLEAAMTLANRLDRLRAYAWAGVVRALVQHLRDARATTAPPVDEPAPPPAKEDAGPKAPARKRGRPRANQMEATEANADASGGSGSTRVDGSATLVPVPSVTMTSPTIEPVPASVADVAATAVP